jgi:phosphohistidine phosphatase SixA
VGRLAAELAGSDATTIEMTKGAVAALEFDGHIEPGRGRLVWLVTAKMLGA